MSDTVPLTIIIGPQSGLGLALNTLVRNSRVLLAKVGLLALPSRIASPLIRRNLDQGRPIAERLADFKAGSTPRPVLLSATNFLGPPQAGLHRGELFPDAEHSLAGLGDLAGKARIVLAPDCLPTFLLAAGSGTLEDRVRRTSWEALYELSWSDLVREILHAVPQAELLVLSPRGAAVRSPEILARLFGPAASAIADPHTLLRSALTTTGIAVLDRLIVKDDASDEMLGELYDCLAMRADQKQIETSLGIERITATLLENRFSEDLDAIAGLPGTEVI